MELGAQLLSGCCALRKAAELVLSSPCWILGGRRLVVGGEGGGRGGGLAAGGEGGGRGGEPAAGGGGEVLVEGGGDGLGDGGEALGGGLAREVGGGLGSDVAGGGGLVAALLPHVTRAGQLQDCEASSKMVPVPQAVYAEPPA